MVNQIEIILRDQLLDRHRKLETAIVRFRESDHLRHLLREVDAALDRLNNDTYGMISACLDDLKLFSGGARKTDDLTIMAVRWAG